MTTSAFGIDLDVITIEAAVQELAGWLDKYAEHCRYVVTPNVDHILTLKRDDGFRRAYSDADLRLIDGWPVAKAVSWLTGVPATTVPGSDLVPALFGHLESKGRKTKVFLLGALPGVAEVAAQAIESRWSTISIVGTYSPPFGFERDATECNKICSMLREVEPDLLVLGLGAPKQELWIHRHRGQIGPCVAICAGATIDFLAGSKKRAPAWIRRARCEWLYRMMQEPRRLVSRYTKGLVLFPLYVLQEKFVRK